MAKQALSDIKVLELGQLIAGPFATKLLAEFGADVIKVEPPNAGDALRKWRILQDGTSLWWHAQNHNKRSVVLNLKSDEGRELVKQLASETDVLVENFSPGRLEEWGLGWDELSSVNPRLIMVRISGYGQYGPYRNRPGFGVIGEAMGGLRYLSGHPGAPSVRVGISIGDSLAGLYGALGALIALHERADSGRGQYIDVALYEAVFSIMESMLPEYDKTGFIRQPSGSSLPGITPSNSYPCSDGTEVLIAGNGDSIFKRLMKVIGRPEMAENPRFQHNDGRTTFSNEIDKAISEWTRGQQRKDILKSLENARVPAGYPYTIADIVNDPHYKARNMFESIVTNQGYKLKIPAVIPRLSRTPGRIRGCGPELGEHNREILETYGPNAEK